MFLRPEGPIADVFNKVYRLKTQDLLSTYRATIQINECYDDKDGVIFSQQITEFVKD